MVDKSANSKILRLAGKGSFAVIDQALFAGVNFLLSVLLARWLIPKEYGAFSITFSVFFLLSTFYSAFMVEPMLVFGGGKYSQKFLKYTRFLFSGHWALTVFISLILFIITIIFWKLNQNPLAQAFLGLAISAPFILLLLLSRRAFYVHSEPYFPAVGGIIYLILTVIILYILRQFDLLTPLAALLTIGVLSAVVGGLLKFILYIQYKNEDEGDFYKPGVVRNHWQYGKWMFGSYCVVWLRDNIYYFILPIWLGLETSAALRAVMNFILPMISFNTAISVFILPRLAKVYHSGGIRQLRKMILFCLIFYVLCTFSYWLFLFSFREKLFPLFYGDKYGEYIYLLGVVGVLPFISGFVQVFNNALRVMERPDQIFRAYILTGLLILTLGIFLTISMGFLGAILSLILSYIIMAILIISFYSQVIKIIPKFPV